MCALWCRAADTCSVLRSQLQLTLVFSALRSQFPGKYGRSTAVFKQKIDPLKTVEGLIGGWLPIVSYRYTEAGGSNEIEWTAVPVEDQPAALSSQCTSACCGSTWKMAPC